MIMSLIYKYSILSVYYTFILRLNSKIELFDMMKMYQ